MLAAKGLKRARYTFAHGAMHELPDGTVLADSYHCSRLNTNTGRLTPEMFEAVIAGLAERLGSLAPPCWAHSHKPSARSGQRDHPPVNLTLDLMGRAGQRPRALTFAVIAGSRSTFYS